MNLFVYQPLVRAPATRIIPRRDGTSFARREWRCGMR